ncbi:MAG: hypothetical protein R2860_04925 [Desulfobacterales bacterium]
MDGKVFSFLGLSVGTILHGMDDAQRKRSYRCDVIYGTTMNSGLITSGTT